jgi:hypothetical protein
MTAHARLIDACLAASPHVRHVAAYLDGVLEVRSRDGVPERESDRYEELIVNPTLLTLLRQRGDIDCGGCHHVVVAYGTFFAFVYPMAGGHVTIGFEPGTPLDAEIPRMVELIERTRAG